MGTTKDKILSYLQDHGPTSGPELMTMLGKPPADHNAYLRYPEVRKVGSGKGAVYELVLSKAPDRPAPLKAVEQVEISVGVSKLDTAIHMLADVLVERVTAIVEQKTSHAIESLVEGYVANAVNKIADGLRPKAIPVSKPKRPKIMVAGLLPDQVSMIDREFSDALDIRFVGSNDNIGMWKSCASHAEVVFVMGDFVSHASIHALESVSVKPVIVKGGMTTLRDALTQYYAGV